MDRRELGLRADRDPRGVTHANWQDPPFNRWAFLHLDELLTMAPISRGCGPAREFPRAERDLFGLTLEVRGERLTLGQMLAETFTDAFLVVHEGKVVTELYADGMSEDTLHLTMSVSKSLTSALAGALAGQGRLDLAAPVPAYVEELRGTSFDGFWSGRSRERLRPPCIQAPCTTTCGGSPALAAASSWLLASMGRCCWSIAALARSSRNSPPSPSLSTFTLTTGRSRRPSPSATR